MPPAPSVAPRTPKYKDYILPLIFTKRLCDVFDDELNRIAPLVPDDPEQPVWSVIRKLSD